MAGATFGASQQSMLLAARVSAASKSQAQAQAPKGTLDGAKVAASTTLYVGKIAPQVRGASLASETIRARARCCCSE